MSFNCPHFIEEFKGLVNKLKPESILEVGCFSGELKDAVGADGIDLNPKREDVIKSDILDYKPKRKYELVFSSGLIEHYDYKKSIDIIKAMSKCSKKYVLNYVPNKNCTAYQNAKKKTKAEWKDELDFTQEELAKLHEDAGLEVVETGTAGTEWAKRFDDEPSEPYLVYCLAKKKYSKIERSKKLGNKISEDEGTSSRG